MEKLTMCRICLVENVSMYEVANKDLQELYEKLTDIPFVTEDCRPMLACFFCYAKLKQCCQLLRKCLNAEEVFAQMLNGDYKKIPSEFQDETEFCGGLIITSIDYMSIGANTEQLPAVGYIKQEIEPKEEYLTFEVESIYQEDSNLYQKDIPSQHSEINLQDDVHIMTFKTEEDEEIEELETNTKAPVAKKPKLDIWKAKLEDTITDKQKNNGLSDSKIVHTIRNDTSKSVRKFREPIVSDTIAKPILNNSTLYRDEEVIEESLNRQKIREVIKTAIDANNSNNSNQDKGQKHEKTCQLYTCDVCPRNFTRKTYLESHYRTHTGEKPFKCDVCQCIFSSKSYLESHYRTHTSEKPYECNECQRRFKSKSNLNKHVRIHTGEKPYKCDVCQRSFIHSASLIAHHRTHTGEKPYKCDVCKHCFTSKSNLDAHVRIHTGEKPYKCDVCQRSFTHNSSLNLHHRIHTGEKPYECNICQRRFKSKSHLNKHVRVHTGEKPYKCDVCQRSFPTKSHLESHHRTHTGEKPYNCDVCHCSFSQKGHLKSHHRIHTGEKPFKCDVCQRGFTQKSNLRKHVRAHTGEKPYTCDRVMSM